MNLQYIWIASFPRGDKNKERAYWREKRHIPRQQWQRSVAHVNTCAVRKVLLTHEKWKLWWIGGKFDGTSYQRASMDLERICPRSTVVFMAKGKKRALLLWNCLSRYNVRRGKMCALYVVFFFWFWKGICCKRIRVCVKLWLKSAWSNRKSKRGKSNIETSKSIFLG